MSVARRPFLAELTGEDRDTLFGRLRRGRHDAGTVLMRESEPGNDVLVLLAGRVKLVARVANDREVLFGVREAGDLLGELSAIDGRPRAASVVALEDVEVGYLTSGELRTLLADRPRVAFALMRVLTARLREADRGRVEMAASDVLGRVVARLLELCERYGTPTADGVHVALPITQDELASWAGTSRQAVARALTLMRDLDWITTGRRTIIVHDLEALRLRAT